MDFKNKTALVWGTGIEAEEAVRLCKDFKKVYYFTPWQESQKYVAYSYGKGLAPNLEKTLDFYEHKDEADIICLFDIGTGMLAEDLRKQGKRVFGGGKAERFEEFRYKFRLLQGKVGLPVQKTELVKGVTALREYVKKHPNVYVKVDTFRNDVSSFMAKNYDEVELKIDELESNYGPFKEEYSFMVEEYIASELEIGIDTFFAGDWVLPGLFGLESDKTAYIGRVIEKKEQLPKQLIETMDKLSPLLRKVDYLGAISIEIRIMKDGQYFIIDPSIRFMFPGAAIYTGYLNNFSDVIWSVAEGKPVPPKYSGKYVGCLRVTTPHAEDNWVRLVFPEALRSNLKLEYGCKVDKHYYAPKGPGMFGTFIANGNTLWEVISSLRVLAEKADCDGYENNLVALDGFKKPFEAMKKMKMEF